MESTDWIEQWFTENFPEIIDTQLVEAYKTYIKSLDPELLRVRIGSPRETGVNSYEIGDHLAKGDAIGKEWALILYCGTYHRLSLEEKEKVRADPKYLIQLTVNRLTTP